MRIEVANLLADYCGGEVREAYSGRGMLGKETAGIVVNDIGELFEEFVRNATDIALEAGSREIDLSDFRLRWDGMGRQIIVY